MTRPFDEAIERARAHLRLASVEGLETARALLDAVAIAQWVVCAGDESSESGYRNEVDQLHQQLLAHAAEIGFSDMVGEDENQARIDGIAFGL